MFGELCMHQNIDKLGLPSHYTLHALPLGLEVPVMLPVTYGKVILQNYQQCTKFLFNFNSIVNYICFSII